MGLPFGVEWIHLGIIGCAALVAYLGWDMIWSQIDLRNKQRLLAQEIGRVSKGLALAGRKVTELEDRLRDNEEVLERLREAGDG